MKRVLCSTYRVDFVTSSDSSSYVEVEASSEKDARRKAKIQLGKECYRIVSVRKQSD